MSTTPPPGPGNPGGGQFQSVFGGGAGQQPPQQPQSPPPPPPRMGPPPPPPPPQMSAPPPGAAWPPPAQKKGLGPIAWVLIILGGLFVCFILIIVAAGLFVVHKAKQAGIDPTLMQKNPTMAVAKLAVAANPDYELVSEDDDRGMLTIREKKTGKTITINSSDVKNGKLVIKGDNNETVTIGATGNGSNSGIEVKTNDGTARFGTGPVNLPSWLPNYPGSKPEATGSSETAQGTSAVFTFKTDDAPEKVVGFYKDAFTSAGLKETGNVSTGEMSMIGAKDDSGNREATVTVTKEGGANMVHVTFNDKK